MAQLFDISIDVRLEKVLKDGDVVVSRLRARLSRVEVTTCKC